MERPRTTFDEVGACNCLIVHRELDSVENTKLSCWGLAFPER
jgi:hypothetical protein